MTASRHIIKLIRAKHDLMFHMEQDREELVVEITNYIQGLKNRHLTSEELAILLVHDIIGPRLDQVKDTFTRLAYVHGATFPC